MKKRLFIISLFVCTTYILIGQSVPQGINYQASARSLQGDVLPFIDIVAEVAFYLNSESEQAVYKEIHYTASNAYGIFNLTIGQGQATNDAQIKDFSNIDWFAGSYIMKVRADFGSDEFLNAMQDLGSYTILSVPYAFRADKAHTAEQITGEIILNLEDLNNVVIDSNPQHMQILAWNTDAQAWVLNDTGGIPDIFVRQDGSSDLTDNWTISQNNIRLESGTLYAFQISGLEGVSVSGFSNDTKLTDSSDILVPTQSAVKAYVDNSAASGPWSVDEQAVYLSDEKKLGVGTSSPADKFHVDLAESEGFLVRGVFGGNIPDLSAGTQMIFYPAKAAFRAGRTLNAPEAWHQASVGNYSSAFGLDITASGEYTFAAGRTNSAPGLYSSVFGRDNQTLGNYSFSAGYLNRSSALYSISLGTDNAASGVASIAIGSGNSARADYAFVTGLNSQAGNDIGTKGIASFAAGELLKAEGDGSFVSGKNNLALGDYSFITGEDNYTASTANHAFVFGKNNFAEGLYSFSGGMNTMARTYAETVFGQYNYLFSGDASSWILSDPLFVVGSGTSVADRKNALLIMKNGNVGIGTGVEKPTALLQVGTDSDGSHALANSWLTFSGDKKSQITKYTTPANDLLQQLNAYSFAEHSEKKANPTIGFKADELEALFPELVFTDKFGNKYINYPLMSVILTEAYKNQQAEIQELQTENEELKTRLDKIESQNNEILELLKKRK